MINGGVFLLVVVGGPSEADCCCARRASVISFLRIRQQTKALQCASYCLLVVSASA